MRQRLQKHPVIENAVKKIGINKGDAKFNDEPVLSVIPVDIAILKLIRDDITLSDMFRFESFSLDDILKKGCCAYLQSYFNSNFK